MNDVKQVVKEADKSNDILEMRATDFRHFKDGCKQRRIGDKDTFIIPKLENIRTAEFRKSSRSMFYKNFIDDEIFKESVFLKPNFKLQLPDIQKENVGINSKKLNKIKSELLPHMHPRKRTFWNEMDSSDVSKDLCTTFAG